MVVGEQLVYRQEEGRKKWCAEVCVSREVKGDLKGDHREEMVEEKWVEMVDVDTD